MVKPEEESEEAAKSEGAGKKPTRFGKADESHEKQTEYDEESDRVSGEISAAVAAKGDDLANGNFGWSRNDF
jgi:hypothetical protein